MQSARSSAPGTCSTTSPACASVLKLTAPMNAEARSESTVSAARRELDPEGELRACGPSFRLPAETVRDGALYASGLLVEQLGGPPVKPYQPPGLWREKSGATYTRDRGAGSHRRSVYTFWKRTSPPPSMMVFDAAVRDVCVARRQVTASPLQALVLLNDPQYVEAARALGERMIREGGSSIADRAEFAFRWMTGRAPDGVELDVLVRCYHDLTEQFGRDPAAARRFLEVGDRTRDLALDEIEAAACALLASTVMSHDEAVTLR